MLPRHTLSLLLVPYQRKYNVASAIAGEIWQYCTGGNLTILTKVTTLLRKADCEQLQVLAAKYTASLQLLCAIGGNQARSDARSEFKILERSPKGGWKLVVHIAIPTPDQSRLITSVYVDFDILALAFRADTLSSRDFVSFAFACAFSFSASPIASLIESIFANFVFKSMATRLYFF